MPRLVKPRALRRGATLGIAAPGMPVDATILEQARGLLADLGFRSLHRDDLLARRGYLAGDDERRAAELTEFWKDPRVDGIVCARAGYGCDRILHLLDPAAAREAAKPLVGYSDVTALLLWQRRCAGLMGFHGPMLERGSDVDAHAWEALRAQLTGEVTLPCVLRGVGRGGGAASGRLVGGSLTLVVASLGTPWEVDTRGAILLLEDVGERPYRIDRMLQQLRAAGKLARVAGFGVGAFADCVDARYPEPGVDEVIAEALGRLGVPLVTGLPFGHVRANQPWPCGGRATIDGDRGELSLLERGVRKST